MDNETTSISPPPSPPPPRHAHQERDRKQTRSRRGGKISGGGSLTRSVLVSKALSRLLRHAAPQERIPIDAHGYVRLDHVLGWQKMKSFQPAVTMSELVDAVKGSDKQRFGLRFVAEEETMVRDGLEGIDLNADGHATGAEDEQAAKTETETNRAVAAFSSQADPNPKRFFIRATQGHSIALITADNLLSPITLADETSVPAVIVHGTFYAAWERIVKEECLKKMGRNHIHFATGPAVDEVVGTDETRSLGKGKGVGLSQVMERNKVVSGMRRDAQVLIYINVQKALAAVENDDAAKGESMKWWRSENGVILTEGLGPQGEVDSRFWEVVVEVKEGVGVLWRQGDGVVRDLPERLKGRSLPRGKGGRGSGER